MSPSGEVHLHEAREYSYEDLRAMESVVITSGAAEFNQEALEDAWDLARHGVSVNLIAFPNKLYNVGFQPDFSGFQESGDGAYVEAKR
jgi:hypothetical protein